MSAGFLSTTGCINAIDAGGTVAADTTVALQEERAKRVGILRFPSTKHGCTALTCLVTTFVSAKRHSHVTQAGRQQIGVKHWSTSTESDMEAFGSRPSDVKVAAFASEGYCIDELSERCVSLELT